MHLEQRTQRQQRQQQQQQLLELTLDTLSFAEAETAITRNRPQAGSCIFTRIVPTDAKTFGLYKTLNAVRWTVELQTNRLIAHVHSFLATSRTLIF